MAKASNKPAPKATSAAKADTNATKPSWDVAAWEKAEKRLKQVAKHQKEFEPSYYTNYVQPCEEMFAAGNRTDDLLAKINALVD